MNRKILFILYFSLMLMIGYNYADESHLVKKNNTNNENILQYDLRIYEQNKDKEDYKYYTIKEIKDQFLINSKNISMQELDSEMLKLQAQSSKDSRTDLQDNIWDLQNNVDDMYEKIDAIDAAISNPLTPQIKIPELLKNKEKLEDSIDNLNEKIDSMEKSYIMLDFKHTTDKLNAEYNKASLESFKKTELLNLDNKILDILETNINRKMKENELEFMQDTLKIQRLSFKLGYTDQNTLKDFENKVINAEKDYDSLQKQLYTKINELEIICGIKKIDGLTINKKYFDTKLPSNKASYYKEQFKKNAYSVELLNKQIKEMDKTTRKLKGSYNGYTDSKIMKSNKEKSELQKDTILENLEIGAMKMISSYDTLKTEINKLTLNLDNSKRKLDGNRIKLSLGHISKLDYDKSELEYNQMKFGLDIMNLKLLKIKLMLDGMANGIVNK